MEGISRLPLTMMGTQVWRQRSVKEAIDCTGIGLHSGRRVHLMIRPAPADHGIVFHRTDLGQHIGARFENVIDTRLCTVLGDARMRIGTVEHLLAALSAKGIDNALIEVSGPEIPILDGSAAPFLFLLDCAGSVEQEAPRRAIEVCRPVRVSAGEAWAELRPLSVLARCQAPVLELELSIDFSAGAIGRQSACLRLAADAFREQVASARTFTQLQDVEQLQAAGLAQGGSLGNALVVDGDKVLNPGGLRLKNEFASHKLVDAVGDLALAGGPLHGRYVANRPGHHLNNALLRALFDNAAAWRFAEIEPLHQAA
jgi:UDP-3-O-[3-hydroxymyristoyl] N-acetylglucosamine deacetylase